MSTEDPTKELVRLRENVKSSFRVHLYGSLMATTGLVYGFALVMFASFMNFYLLAVPKLDYKSKDEQVLKRIQSIKSISSFCLFIGCTTACAAGNFLYNYIGSRRLTIFNQIFYLATVCIMAIPALPALYVARFLQGVSVYSWTILAPKQIKENLPLSLADTYGITFGLCITIGCLAGSMLLSPALEKIWYLVILSPLITEIPRLLLFFCFARMETTSWMVGKKKEKAEIQKNFEFFYKVENAKKMAEAVEKINNKGSNAEEGFMALFSPTYRLQFVVALVLSLSNQLTGMNIITVFSTDIFRSIKAPKPEQLTFGLGVVNVIGALLSTFSLKFVGKRNMFISGLFGQGLGYCLLFLGIGTGIWQIAVLGVYFGMLSYLFSVGGVLFSYVADILTIEGTYFVASVQWAIACPLIYFAKTIEEKLTVPKMFFISQMFCVFAGVFYLGYGVETLGQDKSDIVKKFQKKRFLSHD